MVGSSLSVLVAGDRTGAAVTSRSVRASEFEGPLQLLVGEGDSPAAIFNSLIDQATGELTVLLPAGTLLDPHCLTHLTRRAAISPDASVVLPEIRSIDGHPIPPGLHIEPTRRSGHTAHHSGVAHRAHHPVDVTGSFIMLVRTAAFRRCGGLAPELAGSPFQVASLVMRMLAPGREVVLEDGAVAYAPARADDPERRPGYELFGPGGLVPDGGRGDEPPRVLWIADNLPDRTRTGGEARHLEMIDALRSGGAEVTVWAQHGGDTGGGAAQLAEVGANWAAPLPAHRWRSRPGLAPFHLLDDLLAEHRWSAVIVSDPELVAPVARRIRHAAPTAPLIADLRTVRFPASHRPDADPKRVLDGAAALVESVAQVDGLVAVSAPDAAVLRRAGADVPVFVFNAVGSGTGRGPAGDGPPLFVGDLLHHPNVQALEWWIEELAGLVFARAGRPIRLRAVGRGSEPYRPLWDRPDRIEIAGWRPDLAGELAKARMLVVPLPYPTGTGGRIAGAVRAGVPVVASEAAAAVVPAGVREAIAVGSDADELAAHVARLSTDDAAWEAETARVAAATFEPDGQVTAWNRWWKDLPPRTEDGDGLSRRPDTRRGRRRRARSS